LTFATLGEAAVLEVGGADASAGAWVAAAAFAAACRLTYGKGMAGTIGLAALPFAGADWRALAELPVGAMVKKWRRSAAFDQVKLPGQKPRTSLLIAK
jgi:hypothetical protein